ncbi:MAG: hypothetical protein Q4C30_00435 [Bacteroidia bacterium]|nr:hypothetical protein [Bacteroidia bacterium]
MRNFKTLTIAALALLSNASFAQNTITIKASKAVKPLVESWAKAYNNAHPDVQVVFVKNNESADLSYVSSRQDDYSVAYVGRYALLPVTSNNNPLLSDLNKRSWGKGDIKKLYFADAEEAYDEEDSEANEGKAGRLRKQLNVYSSSSSNSYSATFAQFFGFSAGEIRGNKIAGDDLFLLSAINRDQASITFNSIANIFDTNTRAIKQNIALLPLNLRKETNVVLESGNLDELLAILETASSDLIPVEEFGFAYDTHNTLAQAFLAWVVSEGQNYNHANGFLQLTEKEATIQLATIKGNNATNAITTDIARR